MIDVTPPPPTPFSVGDVVRIVESADDRLALKGQRSGTGIIRAINGGAHFVALHGMTLALPYSVRELEKASDQ